MSLEEFVAQNRSTFGAEEPPFGHMERFNERLIERAAKKKSISVGKKFLRIASAAILLLLVGIGFGIKGFNNIGNDTESVFAADLIGYEQQLNAQIENKMTTLAVLANTDNAPYISETLNLVRELETDFNQLKKELELYGCNQKVKEAIRQNYRARADILDRLMMHMDYGERLNNTYNASTEVRVNNRVAAARNCGFGWTEELPVRKNEVLYGAFYSTK